MNIYQKYSRRLSLYRKHMLTFTKGLRLLFQSDNFNKQTQNPFCNRNILSTTTTLAVYTPQSCVRHTSSSSSSPSHITKADLPPTTSLMRNSKSSASSTSKNSSYCILFMFTLCSFRMPHASDFQ